jgi:hypothetical protein
MKLRYKNSQEFKDYSKSISDHIKNTPLRPLRLAMSQVDGYSSVQAYCLALDSNKNKDSAVIVRSSNSMRVDNGSIYFSADISLNENIKYRGLEAWDDYINNQLLGGAALCEPEAEYKQGGIFSCSGCIEVSDYENEELYEIVEAFLSSHINSNYHIVADELMNVAEKYIFDYLGDGGELYKDMLSGITPDKLSNINVDITSELLVKTIPSILLADVERDVMFEISKNTELSTSIIKSIALKDIVERLILVAIGDIVFELLYRADLDSITEKRWETLLVNNDSLLDQVKNEVRMPLMKKIAFSQI